MPHTERGAPTEIPDPTSSRGKLLLNMRGIDRFIPPPKSQSPLRHAVIDRSRRRRRSA
jgi:hypothetical protein